MLRAVSTETGTRCRIGFIVRQIFEKPKVGGVSSPTAMKMRERIGEAIVVERLRQTRTNKGGGNYLHGAPARAKRDL